MLDRGCTTAIRNLIWRLGCNNSMVQSKNHSTADPGQLVNTTNYKWEYSRQFLSRQQTICALKFFLNSQQATIMIKIRN